jgi:biotin transport system substrate-specific component
LEDAYLAFSEKTFMTATTYKQKTLVFTVVSADAIVRKVLLALTFSWLIAAAAQIAIPIPGTPVPITGQSFAVLLTGVLLGPRWGVAAVLMYLAQGGLGLPFFRAGAGGMNHLLFAVTSGYLLSFPFAAALTGWLAERGWDRNVLTAMAAMGLGSLVVLGCGWIWLSAATGSAASGFQTGVLPFLIPDVVKISLAGCALPLAWRFHDKVSSKR